MKVQGLNQHLVHIDNLSENIYKEYADRLIENGHAYYAFDSAEELEDMKTWPKAKMPNWQYNLSAEIP